MRTFVCALVAAFPSVVPAQRLLLADPTDHSRAFLLLQEGVRQTLGGEWDVTAWGEEFSDRGGMTELEQARGRCIEAKEQFEALEPDRALSLAQEGAGKAGQAMTQLPALGTLIECLSLKAAAAMLLGKRQDARSTLLAILAAKPGFVPDAVLFNPDMMALVHALQGEQSTRPEAELRVTTDPPGAAVYIDDTFVGLSPLSSPRLLTGTHYVRTFLPGHVPAGAQVQLGTGGGAEHVRLVPSPYIGERRAEILQALRALTEDRLAPSAITLMDRLGANEVVVLIAGQEQRLARGPEGGTHVNRSTEPVVSIEGARFMAGRLLAAPVSMTPLARAPIPGPGAIDTGGGGAGTAGIVMLSLGGAAGVVGGVFGILARLGEQEYYNQSISGGSIDHGSTTDQREGVEVQARAEGHALVADILFGSAAVTGIIGIILLATDSGPNLGPGLSGPDAGWSWSLLPGGLRVSF